MFFPDDRINAPQDLHLSMCIITFIGSIVFVFPFPRNIFDFCKFFAGRETSYDSVFNICNDLKRLKGTSHSEGQRVNEKRRKRMKFPKIILDQVRKNQFSEEKRKSSNSRNTAKKLASSSDVFWKRRKSKRINVRK